VKAAVDKKLPENGGMQLDYQGKRVLTTKRLAAMYEIAPNTIHQIYLRHRDQFEEGEHFFALTGDELKSFKKLYQDEVEKYVASLYLWTEKGALLIAQTQSGPQSWKSFSRYVHYYMEKSDELKQSVDEIRKIFNLK